MRSLIVFFGSGAHWMRRVHMEPGKSHPAQTLLQLIEERVHGGEGAASAVWFGTENLAAPDPGVQQESHPEALPERRAKGLAAGDGDGCWRPPIA